MLKLFYGKAGGRFLAKIAVELQQALAQRREYGSPGRTTSRLLARGKGWTVSDVICTCGPQDRPFEERHSGVSIAIVTAGTFQYRGAAGSRTARELMMPGSLLLGSAGQCFECGHEHGAGDRCLSFWYAPDYFERIAADAGRRGTQAGFKNLRLPPLRALAPLVASACASLIATPENAGRMSVAWEELALKLAAQAIQLEAGLSPGPGDAPPSAVARVTRSVRKIERDPAAALTVAGLAREAKLSPYHFLRIFERLTGLTPHQYVLRARLREAALRVAAGTSKVLDIAFDCGFGDVSNFNRAFRTEFGASPRGFRSCIRAGSQMTSAS